jgi:nucleoid-associated protein YgaU
MAMGFPDENKGAGSTAAPDITGHTYVVRVGDTLAKIAEEMLGDSGAATDIFNANRDQLSDPNALRPGQVLKIPVPAGQK